MLKLEQINIVKSKVFEKIQMDYKKDYSEKTDGPKISIDDIYIGDFISGLAIVYIKWPISEYDMPCDYEGSCEEFNKERDFPNYHTDYGSFLVNEEGEFVPVKICDHYYNGLEADAVDGISALRSKFFRICEEDGTPTEYIIYKTGLYKADWLWKNYREYKYHDFYYPKEDEIDDDEWLYSDDEDRDPEMSTYNCIKSQEERVTRYAAIINHKNEIVFDGPVALFLDNILRCRKYLLIKEHNFFPSEIGRQIYQEYKYLEDLYTDIVSDHYGVFDFSQKKEIIACRFKKVDITYGGITTYTYSDVRLKRGIRYESVESHGDYISYTPSRDYWEYKCKCIVPNFEWGKAQKLTTQFYLIRHGKYAGWFLQELATEQFKTLLNYAFNCYIHICKVSDLSLSAEEKSRLSNIMDLHLEYEDIESDSDMLVPTSDYYEIYPEHECKHPHKNIEEIISEDYKYICMLVNNRRLRINPQAFRDMCILHYEENEFLWKLKKVYECMKNREVEEEQEMEEYNDRSNSYDDYDDTPSIYDNPYYDDDLDMDQQSLDFWNNL